MLTFVLAECSQCRAAYAVMPSPTCPGQWQVFPRHTRDFAHPLHLCAGELVCLHGHRLRVTQSGAVLSEQGHWVSVGAGSKSAAAN